MGGSGHIRSFVLRGGKMTPAQRRAYEDLRTDFVIPGGGRLDLDRLFPGRPRRILEIGFGMGEATAAMAEANPDTGYIGMEVHPPGVGKLLWEIRRRGLRNLVILEEDAAVALESRIPDSSLDGIHIFFPDPWPKKRHHKRRLISPGFAATAAAKLRAGAYILVVTDWEDYAETILSVLGGVESLDNPHRGYAPPQSWRPRTAFESKGREAGREIREILFRKR